MNQLARPAAISQLSRPNGTILEYGNMWKPARPTHGPYTVNGVTIPMQYWGSRIYLGAPFGVKHSIAELIAAKLIPPHKKDIVTVRPPSPAAPYTPMGTSSVVRHFA